MNRTVLSVAALLLVLTGCVPSPESQSKVATNPAAAAGNAGALQAVQETGRPEVTAEKIAGDMVGRVVRVSGVTGASPATDWTFEKDEFRQVEIREKHLDEHGLTFVVFATTRNNPAAGEDHVQVSGKLRVHYEWSAGRWMLTAIENMTFAYSLGLSA